MAQETAEELDRRMEVAPHSLEARNTQLQKLTAAWPTILLEIASGSSLTKSVYGRGISLGVIHQWLLLHPDQKRLYDEAYTVQADYFADRITDIANDLIEAGANMTNSHVSATKVAMDAWIWACAIRNRKKYGEHKTVEIEQPIDPRSARKQLEDLKRELAPVINIVVKGDAQVAVAPAKPEPALIVQEKSPA